MTGGDDPVAAETSADAADVDGDADADVAGETDADDARAFAYDDDRETPDGAPFTCPHCGRPFVRERYRDLHLGLAHADALTDGEREAHEAARAEEERALRLFRYKALGALVVIYFGFIIVYAFAL